MPLAIKRKRSGSEGFTLVELIIVIVILIILMSIAIPSVSGYVARARKSAAAANARTAYMALCVAIADKLQSNPYVTFNVDEGADLDALVADSLSDIGKIANNIVLDNGTVPVKDMLVISSSGVLSGIFEYSESGYTVTYNLQDGTWTLPD